MRPLKSNYTYSYIRFRIISRLQEDGYKVKEIGKMMGYKDHTTVVHHLKRDHDIEEAHKKSLGITINF